MKQEPADLEWTNPSIVGDLNNKISNDRQVILDWPTLEKFKSYMSSKTFAFNYDLAIGVFEFDHKFYLAKFYSKN